MSIVNLTNKLFEIAYSGLVRKQRSIPRLFPDWPDKVKGIGRLGGLRLRDQKHGYWHFKIHSGTKKDVWYDAYIGFKNIENVIGEGVRDRRLWTQSRDHVNMSKLAKYVLYHVDLQLYCSDPSFLYWGYDYILSRPKRDAKYGRPENRPPRRRNPRQYGAYCKHLHNLLNVLPWYESTMAKYLTEFYGKHIAKLERDAQRGYDEFRAAAAELGMMRGDPEAAPEEMGAAEEMPPRMPPSRRGARPSARARLARKEEQPIGPGRAGSIEPLEAPPEEQESPEDVPVDQIAKRMKRKKKKKPSPEEEEQEDVVR
jgi:hypothetical protein